MSKGEQSSTIEYQGLPAPHVTKTDSKPSDLKGFEWWRRTLQYQTGLGITREEQKRYENDEAYKKYNQQCNECYEFRDWMMNYSPTVRFMIDNIKQLGGNINDKNIICDVCDDLKSGGFNPELGILICQNRLIDKWHLEDTLSHELVHAYDHLKFQVNWANLKHHACSEIRASTLSGECRFMNQIFRSGLSGSFGKKFQECVKRRATISVQANPNCKDKDHADKIVDEVWQSCFNDTRPFEEIYR